LTRPAAAMLEPPGPTLVEDLVAANRILVNQGILDTLGHVSVRHARDPNRYLLSQSRAPELVDADDIMEYGLDSNPLESRERPMYLERFIHGEIYKLRPDVRAVCHNHAPSLIPFGVTDVPLRPIFQSAAFLVEGVPVFEIRDAFGMTDMLIRNPALGRALAETLANRNAVLVRGHGAVVVGPSLPIVVRRSINLEEREVSGAGDGARRKRHVPRPRGSAPHPGERRRRPRKVLGVVEEEGLVKVGPSASWKSRTSNLSRRQRAGQSIEVPGCHGFEWLQGFQ